MWVGQGGGEGHRQGPGAGLAMGEQEVVPSRGRSGRAATPQCPVWDRRRGRKQAPVATWSCENGLNPGTQGYSKPQPRSSPEEGQLEFTAFSTFLCPPHSVCCGGGFLKNLTGVPLGELWRLWSWRGGQGPHPVGFCLCCAENLELLFSKLWTIQLGNDLIR